MEVKVIDKFDGNYKFLSNYFEYPITYGGITYQSSEAAFQAQKCPERANEFADLPPNEAKALGRKVPLREDWETIKDNIMYEIIYVKFSQTYKLKKALLETGDAELVEGNTWNDKYWGVCDGEGQNKLGSILMRVRDELGKRNITLGQLMPVIQDEWVSVFTENHETLYISDRDPIEILLKLKDRIVSHILPTVTFTDVDYRRWLAIIVY